MLSVRPTKGRCVEHEIIPKMSRAQIDAAIARDEPRELRVAVLAVALRADDAVWAESVCERLWQHRSAGVRGNAVLGLGHIARIHGQLDETRVRPILEAALRDPDAEVRGQAEAAADDIQQYLGWSLKRES